jgi:hypothetical protein
MADPEEPIPPLAPSVAPPVEGWTCPSGGATDASWETGAVNTDRLWTAGPATRAADASAAGDTARVGGAPGTYAGLSVALSCELRAARLSRLSNRMIKARSACSRMAEGACAVSEESKRSSAARAAGHRFFSAGSMTNCNRASRARAAGSSRVNDLTRTIIASSPGTSVASSPRPLRDDRRREAAPRTSASNRRVSEAAAALSPPAGVGPGALPTDSDAKAADAVATGCVATGDVVVVGVAAVGGAAGVGGVAAVGVAAGVGGVAAVGVAAGVGAVAAVGVAAGVGAVAAVGVAAGVGGVAAVGVAAGVGAVAAGVGGVAAIGVAAGAGDVAPPSGVEAHAVPAESAAPAPAGEGHAPSMGSTRPPFGDESPALSVWIDDAGV